MDILSLMIDKKIAFLYSKVNLTKLNYQKNMIILFSLNENYFKILILLKFFSLLFHFLFFFYFFKNGVEFLKWLIYLLSLWYRLWLDHSLICLNFLWKLFQSITLKETSPRLLNYFKYSFILKSSIFSFFTFWWD